MHLPDVHCEFCVHLIPDLNLGAIGIDAIGRDAIGLGRDTIGLVTIGLGLVTIGLGTDGLGLGTDGLVVFLIFSNSYTLSVHVLNLIDHGSK